MFTVMTVYVILFTSLLWIKTALRIQSTRTFYLTRLQWELGTHERSEDLNAVKMTMLFLVKASCRLVQAVRWDICCVWPWVVLHWSEHSTTQGLSSCRTERAVRSFE